MYDPAIMKAAELVPLALRVLSACTKHDTPDRNDVEVLREHGLPDEADLGVDMLACAIIRRETEHELSVSRAVREGMNVRPGSKDGQRVEEKCRQLDRHARRAPA
jgi:hypothetical protein